MRKKILTFGQWKKQALHMLLAAIWVMAVLHQQQQHPGLHFLLLYEVQTLLIANALFFFILAGWNWLELEPYKPIPPPRYWQVSAVFIGAYLLVTLLLVVKGVPW